MNPADRGINAVTLHRRDNLVSVTTRIGAILISAGLLVAAGAGTAHAVQPSQQDITFLQAAHQSNLTEIAAGQLAQSKAASQQVKDLGALFVADHTKLDQAVTQTATTLGVSLPDAPNAAQQAVLAQLQAASGTDFDTLFISTQMEAHMAAMSLAATEIAQGSDPAVKQVAEAATPVITAHMKALDEAAAALGVPSRVNGGHGGAATQDHPSTGGVPTGALMAAGVTVALMGGLLLMRRRRVMQ
jgi:putative membrane protein